MAEIIEKPLDDEEVVDQREVKRRNKWTAIVQLATDSSNQATRMITDLNTNYVNSQIHNSNGAAASTPNSAAGMARVIIPSSTTNNNLAAVKKEERFTVRVTARRSGGNSRAVGRGAK